MLEDRGSSGGYGARAGSSGVCGQGDAQGPIPRQVGLLFLYFIKAFTAIKRTLNHNLKKFS